MAILLPGNIAFIPSDATEANIDPIRKLLPSLPVSISLRIAIAYKKRGLAHLAQSLLEDLALIANEDDIYDVFNVSAYIAFTRGSKFRETGFSYLTRGESKGVTPLSLLARVTYLKSLESEDTNNSGSSLVQITKLCQLCLANYPDNPLVLVTLANLYRSSSDIQTSLIYYIKSLQSVIRLSDKSSGIYNTLMDVIKSLSDRFKSQVNKTSPTEYVVKLYKLSPFHSLIRSLITSEINFYNSKNGDSYDSQKLDLCRQYLLNLKSSALNVSGPLQGIILSDISFQLGRLYHVQRDYQSAYQCYNQITHFEPSALFNLVKTSILTGKLSTAKEASDRLESFFHKSSNYYTIYASMLSAISQVMHLVHSEKRNSFKKLQEGNASFSPFNCGYSLLQMDQNIALCERLSNLHNLASKIEYDDKLRLLYIKCLELLLERGRVEFIGDYLRLLSSLDEDNVHIPLKLLKSNKLAAKILLCQSISSDELKTLHSLESDDKLPNGNKDKPLVNGAINISENIPNVYISYNLALGMETAGHIARAQTILKNITTNHPTFIPAWLKRARIALCKNDLTSYNRYIHQSKTNAGYSPEPWLFHSYNLYHMNKISESINEVHNLCKLHPSLTNDSYVQTLLSYCYIAKYINKSFGGGEMYTQLLDDAVRHARKALNRPYLSNFYSANALAVILALSGFLKESIDSFADLIVDITDQHQLYVANYNMAIVMSALSRQSGRTDKLRVGRALTLYKTALKYSDKPPISLCKYNFLIGNLEDSIETLQYLALLYPRNMKIFYNLAVSLDAALCRDLRVEAKVVDPENMQKMRCDAMAVESISQLFVKLANTDVKDYEDPDFVWDNSFLIGMLVRARDKILPHIKDTLPTIEKSNENVVKMKEKRRQAQLEIQQAQIHMQQLESDKREREIMEEQELSNRLLREASEIAAELHPSAPGIENTNNDTSPKKVKSTLFNE